MRKSEAVVEIVRIYVERDHPYIPILIIMLMVFGPAVAASLVLLVRSLL